MADTGAGDEPVRRVRELAAAAEKADGAAPFDEAVLLSLRGGLPAGAHVDEQAACWLAEDAGAADLHLLVHPDHRGRGLGRALLERATAAYEGPVRAWSHGNHPAAAALAASTGFERTRDLWVMRRAAGGLPPMPGRDDVTVRGMRPGPAGDPERDADRDAVLAVNAAAFAHHPEQGALDVAGFEQRAGEDWFDPAGLLLALDTRTEEVLGFHWTKVHLDEGPPTPGEVYVVGVAPEAQGRGLGGLLTLAGLHHLESEAAPGGPVGEVLLYVESDNAAAVRVYERLGFSHADADTHVQYTRPPRE